MKRNLIRISLIMITITLFYNCCGCGKTVNEEKVIKGIVTTFGSEPSVEIGIKTEDNINYEFICSKELKTELLKQQGHWYAIEFSELKVENGVNKVVVEKAVQIIKK